MSVRARACAVVCAQESEFEKQRLVLERVIEQFWHAHASLVHLNRLGTVPRTHMCNTRAHAQTHTRTHANAHTHTRRC